MDRFYKFPNKILSSIVNGRSILDIQRLNITTIAEAERFMKIYGYDWESEADREDAWDLLQQAIDLLSKEWLSEHDEIPKVLMKREKLEHIGHLLVFASATDGNDLQVWSCRILRIMHVLIHLENDPFHSFSEDIHNQIVRPFREHMHNDPVIGFVLGHSSSTDRIHLKRFDVKSAKSVESAAIKLLAKKNEYALRLLDRVGVRFVTNNIFDCYRVLRFLIKEYVISVPNIVPDQAKNTLYPSNIFLELMEEFQHSHKKVALEDVNEKLDAALERERSRANFKEKENLFSSSEYRVIKFIARRRIKLHLGDIDFRFFYPYEVQIMDYETYTKLLQGPSHHDAYKKRQAEAAKDRVFQEVES